MHFDNRDFEKHFAKNVRRAWVLGAIVVAMQIGVVVFIGWVIVKVLQHFGIL